MHLENGGLLTWRYKHFHDFLMRHLLDVHFYYVVMYFDDIYYVLMMFGRIHTRKWGPRIVFPNGMSWRAPLIVGVCYPTFCTIVGLPGEPPVDRLVQSLIPVYQLICLLV